MINIVVLSGIIASAPKNEKIKKGEWATTFYICTYDNYSKIGTGAENLNIFKCVARGDTLSEYIMDKCHKGNTILVRGMLHSAKYLNQNRDKSITEQNVTEITLLGIEMINNNKIYNFKKLPDVEKRFFNMAQVESRKKKKIVEISELIDILQEEEIPYTEYEYSKEDEYITLPIDCDEEEYDNGAEETPSDSI